jgi:hypothetical protein
VIVRDEDLALTFASDSDQDPEPSAEKSTDQA